MSNKDLSKDLDIELPEEYEHIINSLKLSKKEYIENYFKEQKRKEQYKPENINLINLSNKELYDIIIKKMSDSFNDQNYKNRTIYKSLDLVYDKLYYLSKNTFFSLILLGVGVVALAISVIFKIFGGN